MTPKSIDLMLAEAREGWNQVTAAELQSEFDAGALVVDIRPVEQRDRDGELPGALIVDRNVLEWRLDPASANRLELRPEFADVAGATTGYDRRIVLVCNEGYQSSLAVSALRQLGLLQATDLSDGYQSLLSG